jgi:hypothetical protein
MTGFPLDLSATSSACCGGQLLHVIFTNIARGRCSRKSLLGLVTTAYSNLHVTLFFLKSAAINTHL